MLIDYMENNMELITGKLTAYFSFHDACQKWEDLKNRLNATGSGPNDREVKEWKKTWLEMKANAKEKKARDKRYGNGTGGGPKGKPLTEIEERIISLIGDVVCVGIPNVPEFGTGNIQEPNDIIEHNQDPLNTNQEYLQLINSAEFVINETQTQDNEVDDNIVVSNVKTTNKRKRVVDDKGMDELINAEKRKAAALERIAESFEKLTNYYISK